MTVAEIGPYGAAWRVGICRLTFYEACPIMIPELAIVARHKAGPGIVGSEAEALDWMQVSANQSYG